MKSLLQKHTRVLLSALLILLSFSGCAVTGEPEPTVPQWGWLRERSEYLTVIATEEDFALLEECVNLEYLDLTGSTCYDAILNYISRHPNIYVVYTAPLGNTMVTNTQEKAALDSGTYDAAMLISQLKYLPGLTSLTLENTALTPDELDALQAAYPNVQFVYSVNFLGKEYLTDTQRLDLSGLSREQIPEAVEKLSLLPALKEIELMDASGNSPFTKEDVKALMDAAPDVNIHYTFQLFGKTVSTADETIEFEDVKIGNQGEQEIRAALDILPNCTYFKLEDCGLSNEVLASIRDDYPHAKIAWRVYFGGYTTMTDDDTLRAVYNVFDEHVEILKYCTGAKYIDMGHNTELTDLSFVEYMPDLEIMIASGSSVRNLKGFENCKKLEWLELAYCYSLEDISALKDCTGLRFLNISFTGVQDLSPIEQLPLERFLYLDPKVDRDTRAAFEETHPDCWIRFTGQNPYSLGWRYDDIGETFSEYYLHVRDVFDLDDVDKRLAAEEEAKRREEEAKKEQEEAEKEKEEAEKATDPTVTPPATEAPSVTDPPAPPATEAPVVTDPPAPPATEAPAVTDPPAPPATEAPAAPPPADPPEA